MPDRFSFSFDNRRFRLVVQLGLICGVIGILYVASDSIKPFLVALGLAFLMEPAVTWLSLLPIRQRRLPRWLCVVIIYITLFLVVSGMLVWTASGVRATVRSAGPAMTELLQKTRAWLGDPEEEDVLELSGTPRPGMASKGPFEVVTETRDRVILSPKRKVWKAEFDHKSNQVTLVYDPEAPLPVKDKVSHGPLEKAGDDKVKDADESPEVSDDPRDPLWDNKALGRYFKANLSSYLAWLGHQLQEHLNDVVGLATRAVRGVVVVIFNMILCFMVAAFISSDAPNISAFMRDLVPNTHRASYQDLMGRLNRGLSGVIRGQLMICLVNGTLTGIALFLLVKPVFAFPLTLMVAAFSLIPIFGTVLSSVPCILFAMLAPGMVSFSPLVQGLLMLGWIVGIHLLEANVLNPKIIGHAAEIHPVLVVFALVVGGHSYGFVGALLGVAVMSVIQNVVIFCHDKLMAAHEQEQTALLAGGDAAEPPGYGPAL